MKKLILSVFVALSGIVSVNAQFYIGGSFGYNSSITKPEEGNKTKSSSFSISPELGYRLNDKLEFGLTLSASSSSTEMSMLGGNVIPKLKTQDFSVNPYIRYSVIKFNKFNLLGSVNVSIGKGKTEAETNFITVNVTETKYAHWGFGIYPTVIYDLSNKFAVFSHLNFLRFGFSQMKIKDGATTTDFSFALDANDILPTIGLIYKF